MLLEIRKQTAGVTLIELTVTLAILSILATGILPLTQMTVKRAREMELKRNLRVIRDALDEYKRLTDLGQIPVPAFSSGYPKTLDDLVRGVDLTGANPVKKKFLRRLPKDPMTPDGKWGLRAYADPPDGTTWGGQDVYDVYSKSHENALDGSKYRDW